MFYYVIIIICVSNDKVTTLRNQLLDYLWYITSMLIFHFQKKNFELLKRVMKEVVASRQSLLVCEICVYVYTYYVYMHSGYFSKGSIFYNFCEQKSLRALYIQIHSYYTVCIHVVSGLGFSSCILLGIIVIRSISRN